VLRKAYNSTLASQLVSIVEESTNQSGQNVQLMGRCVTAVGKLFIFIPFCLQGKASTKQISTGIPV